MSRASKRSLVQQVVGWLADYFTWVKETFASDTARRAALADLGLDPANPPPLALPADRITSIDRYRNQSDPTEQAFLAVWQDALAVVETIEGFVDAAGAGAGGKAVVKEAVRQFLSLTATEYVRLRHPMAYFVARLFAVIEDTVPQQFHKPVDVLVSKDIFDNLLDLVQAPIDHFDRAYSTPATEEDARRLAANTLVPLGILFAFWKETARKGLGLIGADFELPRRKVLHGWDTPDATTTPLADRLSQQVLSFAFTGLAVSGQPGEAPVGGTMGATLAWVPREHGGPGLFVSVNGAADLNVPVTSFWRLNTKRPTANVVDVLIWDAVDFRPETPATPPAAPLARSARLAALAPRAASAVDDEEVRFTLEPVEAKPEDPYVIEIGGSRIEIGTLAVTLLLSKPLVELKVVAKKSALVLASEDGDGFVAKLLPASGVRLDFDLGVGLVMSPEFRVHVEGGSGLKTTIPIDRSLGPARLQQLHLELASGTHAAQKDLRFEASLGMSLKLGPVTAVADRLGFELIVDMENGAPPRIGFKPPTGVGLVIDAEIVSGAGYLFHDAPNGQYAGVVQLEFRGLTLRAIGLLSTRLPPDGRRGFSLLVIIAAEFLPVAPLGVRLTAFGGIVGINRTFNVDALRAGLKTGALDNILFPPNPVADAPRIVSALQTILPPRDEQFLFGLMARLVFGVPTLVTVDVGVILEFPSPWRLIVLGQLRALLPTADKTLIRLQMDAIGVVDWEENTVAVDAVLFDSCVGRYPITGEMALRARWGNDPTFALAVGGLHPRFAAPSGFPKLARVIVGLSQSKSTRLTLAAYLAVTSNTAQVGARLDFLFRASGFSVEGLLAFDALFQFKPFEFVVDLQAGVTLKWHGRTLLGVELALTLAGPSPWHARGKATFKIWRFSKSVSFDRTLGEAEPPPPLPEADPLPELIAALADPHNWNGDLPATSATLFALRDTPGANEVRLHPLGELSVRQRVVPLGIEITRFGNTTPAGDRRFEVVAAGAAGAPIEDFFAPGQFLDLSDDERLRRPSFERMQAGVRIGASSVTWGGKDDPALVAETDLAYETVVLDEAAEPQRSRAPFTASADDLRLAAAIGAVGRATARHTGPEKYRAPPRDVRLVQTRYTVTSTSDLAPVAIAGLPPSTRSYTVAAQAMQRQLAKQPGLRGRLQVSEVPG